MHHFQYQGVRPRVRDLAARHGADPAKVEGNKSLRALNSLLGQATAHRNKGDLDSARKTLDAARKHLAELDSAAEAARGAFGDVEGSLMMTPEAEVPPQADEGPVQEAGPVTPHPLDEFGTPPGQPGPTAMSAEFVTAPHMGEAAEPPTDEFHDFAVNEDDPAPGPSHDPEPDAPHPPRGGKKK